MDKSLPIPELEPDTESFWRSCRAGKLMINRCRSCRWFIHPPVPVCARCRSQDVQPEQVSGRGVLVSFTVNHQAWVAGLEVPFVLGLVELDEQPNLRLTSRIVNCSIEAIRIGRPVKVLFDIAGDDVALPVFEPDNALDHAPGRGVASSGLNGAVSAACLPVCEPGEHKTVISGVGLSQVGRRLFRSALDLTVEASLRAIADAGLRPDEIDGIATQPGAIPELAPGFNGPTACQVMDAVGLKVNWLYGGMEGAGQLGPVMAACHAVAAGACRHALAFRTVTESSAQALSIEAGGHRAGAGAGAKTIKSDLAFLAPYGSMSAANWLAMYAVRHMHEYGTKKEHLGEIALTSRRHAALNAEAIYREPLTMERYLAARVVTTPFGLYDCDVPCDMSGAVVVSHISTAHDLRMGPVRIAALGMSKHGRPRWDQVEDLTSINADACSAQMWARTGLKPADVDVAQLYDGFSFMVLGWLEALGFCKRGESGPFVEGGRIGLGGALPVNTWGGQLSGGRLHAFGHLIEAVRQLRRECGERQVADCNVAAVSAAGVFYAGCMLLTRY
jgi:acetyl-CoA acetyltransferase/uncharacterized OB-fold protein